MTPANIVGMAALKGLDVIALTDHNSCKNCPAIMKWAKEYGVTVLPGMELTTMEEVHVVCLFSELKDAMAFDQYVYAHLMAFPNDEKVFGKQQIYNEEDQIVGRVENLLINATDISFDHVYGLMEQFHGFMVPAHIDKTANSLLANLGFVPPDSQFCCVELKDMGRLHQIKASNPYIERCRIICDSDAHYLEQIHEAQYTIYAESAEREKVIGALKAVV